MSDKKDYYEVLGIEKGATPEEVKSAYKRMAKKVHPDLNPDDATSEEKFKQVGEAYEVLSDEEKRRRYDQFGHAGVDPSYGGGGGGGYSSYGGFGGFGGGIDIDLGDIFSDFFGGGRSTRTRNPNAPMKGGNIRVAVTLDFLDAVKGVTEKIDYSKLETCGECSGSGAKKGTTPSTCGKCHGAGTVDSIENIPLMGQMRTKVTCPDCGGRGTVIVDKCTSCRGEGRKTKVVNLNQKIPAGINNGQSLVSRGRGDDGINGGPAGDLEIKITVRQDPIFERDGYDIWCDVPLTYKQLVMGDDIVVPTVHGKVSYTVPEGTQPGTVVRLRRKGVPYTQGSGVGDQYLNILLEVPRGLNSKQKKMIEEFDETITEKNYEKRKTFFDRIKEKFS